MKISRNQVSNLIFLILLVVLIFTPVRKPVQIWLNKVLSFSPSVIKEEKRESLNTYNWKLRNLDGNVYNFNNAKGKLILVNFWATWCPPCIAEMPSLQTLYNDYGDKMEFLFVTNDKEEAIVKFLDKNEYNLPVYHSITRVPDDFDTSGIPATFLISKEGDIVVSKVGAADWNSEKFRETLNDLLN
ncbi:TlpA family protein disulfide reductase [Abyssalbus ytuae]|uniref:TlpA family protein disulfide reductase n=1 Tax=Abyssalbus ytuae TaxID=2926907 RepID=A0A9E6ZV12_9FLAO|nr:TlpA disulfide reductase family protein [Abyssalbus ytuae]UOB18298.1 TlpA family protein disulfide reductase [Abyssalbus ytuae]